MKYIRSLKSNIMRYFIFSILLVVPLLLTAQSKKEQIATLNLRVDSLFEVLVNERVTLSDKRNYIYQLSQEKRSLEKEMAELERGKLEIESEKLEIESERDELLASFNALTENILDIEKLIFELEDSLLNSSDSIFLLREKLKSVNTYKEIIEYRGAIIDDILEFDNTTEPSNIDTYKGPDTDSLGLLTSISIREYVYDFGMIVEGNMKTHYFEVTNTGNNPLILEMCKGSCGCLAPKCPNKPIGPGETGYIKVKFNSIGKKNKQTKKVIVTANTDPAQTILTITANVTPSPIIAESCSH